MNPPVTVFVDSGKAVARLSGPLVLGDTYAVTFSGLSTEEAASAPEMIVLGPKPGEIAARSGEDGVLAMTTTPCVEAFGPLPPPPLPRPKQFPHPPPLPNPPVHWRGGPHGSTRMHFYVVAGGQTLAQGDLVLLWAPFEFDEAGEPIQLRGKQGEPGKKGDKGDKGEPGRNGVYVAMDGLYAFHISHGGDHPEDGHLWLHAQDESTLYAHDANGNYLLDENGERIPLYYVGADGHLRYRFFFQDSTHVELDLGKVVTREGLYAFHVSDGSDGEPAGHLMLHGQDLSQLYARDGQGNLILDGDGNPIPLFHIDANGHLHFTFYGNDGQAHESLDLGDVRGQALTWADLTPEQKAELKGDEGDKGDKGDQGDPLTWDDLTEEQKASLKGAKGDPGEDGMSEEEIVALVEDTMGVADDAPTAGSRNWVTSGGLWSVEQAILARIMALATQINAIASKAGGALHFKGSVQSASDLPDDGNEPGDTYDVIDEGGMNYAWTGSEWNALGATIDLSAYALKSDVPSVDSTLAMQGAAADAKATGDALAGKQATVPDLAEIRSGAAAGATAVQPAALSAYRTATAQDAIDDLQNQRIYGVENSAQQALNGLDALDRVKAYGYALAAAYDPNRGSAYAVGDYCTNAGTLFKCTTDTANPPGAWNAANWTAVAVTDEMGGGGAQKNVWYVGSTTGAGSTISGSTTTGDFVLAEGNVVVVKMSFGVNATSATLNIDGTGAKQISTRSGTTTFPRYFWSNEQAIAFVYSGTYYIPCGMVTATIYNTWGLTSLSSAVSDDETKAATPKAVNTRAPLASPAFTGTPTAPTAAAGTNTTQVATTAFVQASLRYSLPAAIAVSDATSTAALQDRAVNTVSVGAAVTTLNLTFPAAVAGYARDFFLRLDCAGTALATIALPSGETVDFGADALAALTGKAGVHLAMFTEIAANHWIVSAKEAEA